MGHSTNIIKTGRDVYFNPQGSSDADGTSIENSVDSPTTAITRVNALSPIPSGNAPASINAAETGTFFVGVTTPDSTSIKCAFASILTTGAFAITSGRGQTNQWGSLLGLGNSSEVFIINAQDRVAALVNAMVVGDDTLGANGSTDNIGFKVSGACDDIFVENRQMELRGDAAIGIEHTATSETPVRYQVDSVEFFNRDQIFFHMNSTDANEDTSLILTKIQEASDATKSVTNSCVTQVDKGILAVTAHTLVADSIAIIGAEGQYSLDAHVCDGDILVETGGQALIRDVGLWIGDITVEAGAVLGVIIQVHIGTVTNNGTINGIIDGECYGSYCPMKSYIESLAAITTASDFSVSPIVKFSQVVDIPEAGDYEYWLSFDASTSTANRSIVVALLKDTVTQNGLYSEEMADSSNRIATTKRFPRDTLTAGNKTFSVEFGRGGGGGGATVTLENVILEIRKLPPEF